MMDDKRVFTQLLAALLIGLVGVVTTLLLLSQGASAQPMLQEQADLAVHKSDDPDPVIAGESLTYTLVITNSGPVTATNVVVTDTLPAGVTYHSATPSQGACGGTSIVTCSLGDLIVSQTATVTIGVAVDPATRGTLSNIAEVSADEADPVSSDNAYTETTEVNAEADLALAKTGDPDRVVAGETLTYTLVVTNNGPSDATGVVVTDTLPLSVTLVTSATTQRRRGVRRRARPYGGERRGGTGDSGRPAGRPGRRQDRCPRPGERWESVDIHAHSHQQRPLRRHRRHTRRRPAGRRDPILGDAQPGRMHRR
jgi:uncharacterized repeat protein (TIGR01451 family)